MRRIVILAAALMLTACGTMPAPPSPEPIVRTVEVPVPVPVKCSPDIPAEPDYPDTDAALAAVPDVYVGSQLLRAGRALARAYIVQLRAALAGCSG